MNEQGRDPFLGLLETFREEAQGQVPLYFCVGLVLEATETSLRVRADGHDLDQDDILVNAALQVNFQEEADVDIRAEDTDIQGRFLGYASCAYGAHSLFDIQSMDTGHIRATEQYKVKNRLRAGDRVLLIPSADRLLYYLVMKVVQYGAVPSD